MTTRDVDVTWLLAIALLAAGGGCDSRSLVVSSHSDAATKTRDGSPNVDTAPTSQPAVGSQCPDGYAPCGKGDGLRCYDLSRSQDHCGACGNGCASGIGYRVLAGLSVGVAPQVVFHLSSKDSAGYPVIESEKEYDLMARIAYAYTVIPKLDVYAEVLPGYSLVTYNQIILGSQAPRARGIVVGGGLGAAFAITERFFPNVGVGYQLGFQTSHGIRDNDVKTKFLRIALGGGVKF